LPIDELRSQLADKDFGLSWGADQIYKYHISYLHDWILRWGYLADIQYVISDFDPNQTRTLIHNALISEISKQLKSNLKKSSAKEIIDDYINRQFPNVSDNIVNGFPISNDGVVTFLKNREQSKQIADLPIEWSDQIKSQFSKSTNYIPTKYGIIYHSRMTGGFGNNLKIAFLDESFANILSSIGKDSNTNISCSSIYSKTAAGF
jgi:hypothetical protein